MTIGDFRQLQELELNAARPHFTHAVILSSITSTELRKVIFAATHMDGWAFAQETEAWTLVDKQLCGLVDRLRAMGYRHTLEVELRLGRSPGKDGFTKFLPEFKEKGVVIITLCPR